MQIRFAPSLTHLEFAALNERGLTPLARLFRANDFKELLPVTLCGEDASDALNELVAGVTSHVLLKNVFTTADIADTPEGFGDSKESSWHTGAFATLLVLQSVNLEPVAYRSENAGLVFVNLVPIKGDGRDAHQSKKEMRGHTDACCFPFSHEANTTAMSPAPDFVVLTGFRNDENIPTRIAPLSEILKRITKEEISELEKPQFLIQAQPSFTEIGDYCRDGAAVLNRHPSYGLEIRFSHSNVFPLIPEGAAAKALANLQVAISDSMEDVTIGEGDILVVDNKRAIHGRSAIPDKPGKRGRWLQRIYAVRADTNGVAADAMIPFLWNP